MTEQPKQGEGELKSHELRDIGESSTPQRQSKDFTETAAKPTFQSANPADIPLAGSSTTTNTGSNGVQSTTPAQETETTQQASTGGGIVGAIRSLLPFGGSSAQTTSQPTTETNVSNLPKADPEVTHESTLSGGTTAQVSTAPGHTAVPDTLTAGTAPVGVAKTNFNEPVSQYAPALASIAGEPEAADPSKKYGHALDSLTGEAPVGSSPGVISSVTIAAGSAVTSAVETVKHAVGYETEESTTTGTGTGTDVTQGTGVTQSVVNSPGTITYEDLPQTGRVHPHEDGTIDVGSGEATSLASRQAGQGVAQNGLGQTSTGHSGGISGASDVGTTGALSNINQEVPKSGVVQPSGEGSANIESASRPGIFATAVGSVAGGAQYVKDSVAGLVGGGQAGDTSEQIAALDRQNPQAGQSSVAYEEGSDPVSYESASAGQQRPVTSATGAGPLTQPLTKNEAGPVVQEKPQVAYEESEPSRATPTDVSKAVGSNTSTTPPTSSATPVPASSTIPVSSNPQSGISGSAQPRDGASGSGTQGVAATGKPVGSAQSNPAVSYEDNGKGTLGQEAGPSTGASLVKEVGAVPSTATPESTTKSGNENVRLPTGDVVQADPKATSGSSSKPVVSAFAKPSTEVAPGKSANVPSSTTASKTPETTTGTTPSSETVKGASTTKPATGTTEVKPSAVGADAKTGTATGAETKAGTAADKEKKKKEQQKSCGCCVIS